MRLLMKSTDILFELEVIDRIRFDSLNSSDQEIKSKAQMSIVMHDALLIFFKAEFPHMVLSKIFSIAETDCAKINAINPSGYYAVCLVIES